MKLTGAQVEQLHDAMLAAYTPDSLRMMVRIKLDVSLHDIVADAPLSTMVFDLIEWAEKNHQTVQLLQAASAACPDNVQLQATVSDILATTAPPKPVAVTPPRIDGHPLWALVAGMGDLRKFTDALATASSYLGARLASAGCGLVTCGWPGVDETVARAFATGLLDQDAALEHRLIQVMEGQMEPVFAAGQLVFCKTSDGWSESLRRADVAILLGGVGGTQKTGEHALSAHKPVFPITDSGGAAQTLYLKMLKNWQDYAWMNLDSLQFQRLARPGLAGIDAAISLILLFAQRRAT